jgi:hypothetical protein
MELQIPVYQAVKFMVYDEDQIALRGFCSKQEALHYVGNDLSLTIKKLPNKYKTYQVEEAPF